MEQVREIAGRVAASEGVELVEGPGVAADRRGDTHVLPTHGAEPGAVRAHSRVDTGSMRCSARPAAISTTPALAQDTEETFAAPATEELVEGERPPA